MPRKKIGLPGEQQAKLIELLNRRLADAIDLQLQSRQAYWNVKGPHFMALRELFDRVTEGVEEYANLIAGRIAQLGGKAEGTAHTVVERSSPNGYRLSSAGGNGDIDTLSAAQDIHDTPARKRPNWRMTIPPISSQRSHEASTNGSGSSR